MDFEQNRPFAEQTDEPVTAPEETELPAEAQAEEEEYEYVFVEAEPQDEEDEPELAEVYDPNRAKKWILSYAAALIGMLVALIPSGVMARTLDGSYPIFYLFIPVIVFLFMKWFKSFRVSRHLVLIGVVSLISAYLTSVICTALVFMGKNNIPLFEVFRASYFLLVDQWTTEDLMNGLLYKVLFFAIGLYAAIELALRERRRYLAAEAAGTSAAPNAEDKPEAAETTDSESEADNTEEV